MASAWEILSGLKETANAINNVASALQSIADKMPDKKDTT